MNRIVLIIALLALSVMFTVGAGGQGALAQQGIVDYLGKLIKSRNVRTKRQALPNRFAVHAAVEAFLNDNVNDPKRLSIVRFGKKLVPTAGAYKWMGGRTYRDWKPLGVVRKGFWEPIGRQGVAVAVRYRATNRLGALVLDDKVFCVSGGVVFDWMELNDFHPTRPQKRSDPMTDQFLDLRKKLR